MDETFNDLIRSAEQSPTYWMHLALQEFHRSFDAMMAAKGVPSRADLAKLMGVSSPTVSRWLNGSENITISTMCRLATVIGAAVHIHVADQKDRGRWTPEVGTMIVERRQRSRPLPEGMADFGEHKARLTARAEGTNTASDANPPISYEVASFPSGWQARRANG